jgi:hypothetical protein
MTLYEALVPAIIANLAVGASFFDKYLISNKVQSEVKHSNLTVGQVSRITEMCCGVSSTSGYFANIGIVMANSVFALYYVPDRSSRVVMGCIAALLVVTVPLVVLVARMKLSDVDQRLFFLRFTLATWLKIELVVLNCLVFAEMAFSLSSAESSAG